MGIPLATDDTDNDDLDDLYEVVQHPGNSRERSSRSVLPKLTHRFAHGADDAENAYNRKLSRRFLPLAMCVLSLALLLPINTLATRSKDVRRLMMNLTTHEASANMMVRPDMHSSENRELETETDHRAVSTDVVKEDGRSVVSISQSTDSSQPSETQTSRAPKVYAFHIRRQDTISIEEKVFLDVWQKRWNQAGYSARILYVEDAMQHPEFANFSSIVDNLIAISSKKRDPELRYCYYRYLAMVAAGGGMMVDIDTRPAINVTQNEMPPSTFTLYCATGRENRHGSQDWLLQMESQSGIPCAASGSAQAWMKVVQHLPWAFEQNNDKRKWTDMHGLLYLQQFGEVELVKEKKVTTWKAQAFDKCAFRTV